MHMTLIRPFRALRPVPTRAREIIAPPYDVLSSAEARERAKGKPWSFLHVSKAEIDLPAGTDPYAGGLRHGGREPAAHAPRGRADARRQPLLLRLSRDLDRRPADRPCLRRLARRLRAPTASASTS